MKLLRVLRELTLVTLYYNYFEESKQIVFEEGNTKTIMETLIRNSRY